MKIAIVSTVGLMYDGITNVIISYLEALDKTDLDIYVIGTEIVHPQIRQNIKNLGCHVIDMPPRKTETLLYFKSLVKFIRKNHVEVVHAHGNSATLAIEMAAAYLGGCKKRIAHSHNTRCDQVKLDKLLRPIFNILYTDAIACGEDAGKWLFGNKKFTVLKNGRDIEQFSYNPIIREEIRAEYNINNATAIGHVGGFVLQKNHKFVLGIFKEILKLEPNVKFFLIGDGALRTSIEKRAEEYGIRNYITFTGNTERVPELLQGLDGMILPSLFEGLPLVVVEWQITGLPSIIADTITQECALTNLVEFCSLSESAKIWAGCILKSIQNNNRVQNATIAQEHVKQAGFDIKECAGELRSIYLGE